MSRRTEKATRVIQVCVSENEERRIKQAAGQSMSVSRFARKHLVQPFVRRLDRSASCDGGSAD